MTTSRLRTVLSKEANGASSFLPKTSPRFDVLPRVEISPASFKIARQAAELFKNGGAGLVIDYGADHAFGDSLRVSDIEMTIYLSPSPFFILFLLERSNLILTTGIQIT
jgi:SAM-dependent MidA family methyltransferase